jgi:hypothetical protein
MQCRAESSSCEVCRKPFELTTTIFERDKTTPTCPRCKGNKVVPQFGGFMTRTNPLRD